MPPDNNIFLCSHVHCVTVPTYVILASTPSYSRALHQVFHIAVFFDHWWSEDGAVVCNFGHPVHYKSITWSTARMSFVLSPSIY